MLSRITFRILSTMISLPIIAISASQAFGGCGSSATEPRALQVVRKVDHIAISCADPGTLFTTLTRTLGLPVAWPLSSYPGFTTGGIYAANVNIETLRFGSPGESGSARAATSIYGIVFESAPLSEVIGEFRRRGADPDEPRDQMREMNGQQVKVWTNVTLSGLSTSNYIVYLCEYAPEMQKALAKRAQDNPVPLGGIGLVRVREIAIAATQAGQTRKRWETIFAPAAMSPDGKLPFDPGPAVLISGGSIDVITGLVLEVDSLEKSRAFLEQKGMLGEVSREQISIDPAKVQGLDIRLVRK